MITFEQHRAALRKAADAGDMEAVREIESVMDTYPEAAAFNEAPEPAMNMENLGLGLKEAAIGIKDKVVGAWDGSVNFGVQGGNILEENILGLRDGHNRLLKSGAEMMGLNSDYSTDSLSIVNSELEANKRQQALVPDGIAKTLGGVAGEIVTAAPLIPLGAPAGLLRGAAAVSAEGFALEAATTAGSWEDRAVAGGWGALGGAVGGSVAPLVGKLYRSLKLKGAAKGAYADDALAREAQGLPVAKNQAGLTAEGDARVLSARNDGGYELDRIDAERLGIPERENLFTSSDTDWSLRQKAQTGEVIEKAESFVPNYKVDATGARESSASVREQAGQELAGGFKAIREADEAAVKQAYQAVSDSAGKDTVISIPNLRGKLQAHIEELLDAGDTATASGLKRMMDRHAPTAPQSALSKAGFLDAKGNPMPAKVNNNVEMSVEDAMTLRKGVTNLYKNGEDNANRITENFKTDLDDAVGESSLGGAGEESIQLFRSATAKARENFVKWDGKGVKGKITKTGVDPNSFAQDPVTTMNRLLGKGQLEELREVKRVVDLNPSLKGAWDKAANVMKLEALEKAMSKEGEFSSAKFAAVMKDLTPQKMEILFGKKEAEEIAKAMRAWNLRGQGSNNLGRGNKSGTAASLTQAATLGGFSMLGIPLPFVAPIAKTVKGWVGMSQNSSTIKALANNSLPPQAAKEAKRNLKASLAKELGIEDIDKYNNVLTMALRNAIRSSIASDGEQ